MQRPTDKHQAEPRESCGELEMGKSERSRKEIKARDRAQAGWGVREVGGLPKDCPKAPMD